MAAFAVPVLASLAGAAATAGISKLMQPKAPAQGQSSNEADLAAARQAEQLSIDRQRQIEERQSADAELTAARSGRVPRGRRLLLASSGEQGLQTTLG